MKRLQQDELSGVSRATVTKCLNGHKRVTLDDATRLAVALDVTVDYLVGLGNSYESVETASSAMSFAIFERDITVTADQKQRCRRVMSHDGAPKTAKDWRALSEMIEIALGPPPLKFGAAKRA